MTPAVDLDEVLGNVPGATAHRYDVKDDAGHQMDCAKVISNPAGGYLAVYHHGDTVSLATGADLMSWRHRWDLDPEATQPTIAALPTGGFLTAVEHNDQRGSGGRIRLRHYPDLPALLRGGFDRERTIDRTLSRCNEGTPGIDAVHVGGSLDDSRINLGLHYHRGCRVDRQAVGTLTDFTSWSCGAATDLDDALTAAAAADGHRVRGNIGARDSARMMGTEVMLAEVQYRRGDFGSWRIYRRYGTGSFGLLPVSTHRGSRAFANPSVSVLLGPAGRPAVVVTLFLPGEGAAPGEAGELIYYRELEPDPGRR